jgi:hypothetical protein
LNWKGRLGSRNFRGRWALLPRGTADLAYSAGVSGFSVRMAGVDPAGRIPASSNSRCRRHALGATAEVVSMTPRTDHIMMATSVAVISSRTRPRRWAAFNSCAMLWRSKTWFGLAWVPPSGRR